LNITWFGEEREVVDNNESPGRPIIPKTDESKEKFNGIVQNDQRLIIRMVTSAIINKGTFQ